MRQLLSIDDVPLDMMRALTAPRVAATEEARAPRGTLALLFQQPSLRTLSSFARAGVRLGLAPVPVTTTGDAFRDRCDFEDEIRQLRHTSSCVVVRRSCALDREAIKGGIAPLVNAGDGSNEHPTQSLVDVATMRCLGLEGHRVVLMGNLRDHRVHHSLAKALAAFGVPFTPVCPAGFAMDSRYLRPGRQCIETSDTREVDAILSEADFIYLTPAAYYSAPAQSATDAYSLDLARARRVLKPAAKILHPFPRMEELARDLDDSSFDAYHQQTRLGPEIRFRILRWLLEDQLPEPA